MGTPLSTNMSDGTIAAGVHAPVHNAIAAVVNNLPTNPTAQGASSGAQTYHALVGDVILATAGTGGLTVYAPQPALNAQWRIKNIDGGAGGITILPYASEQVEFASSRALFYKAHALHWVSDGTNWYII